jgi:hypothetical protein
MGKNVNETPTLAQVIKDAIENRLVDVHVSLPAKIVKYDAKTQKAEVQALIKRTFVSGESVDLPVFTDLPVAWPRAGKAWLHMPLKAGDFVQVVFSERSLDEWKLTGASVTPKERRKHHLSDGWVIPGGYPFGSPMSGSDDKDVLLVHDKTEFRLTSGGRFSMKGNGGEELLKILHDFLEVAERATTNTVFGPMRWNEHGEIIAIRNRLKKIKL